MITIHTSAIEQDLIYLELETYQVGRGFFEQAGRTFTEAGFLRGVDGDGNDVAESVGTDYRQLVRWDDELQVFWIKSASNFGLGEPPTSALQAIADSYESVSTIEHEFPVIEEQ